MIASLPMYDRPANRDAHDLLWSLIRDALRDRGEAAPDRLTRDVAYNVVWGRPDLVLGHVCILPFRTTFHSRLTVIGASDYGLEGCARGYYRSVYVMRKDDARAPSVDLRVAVNSADSHSGFRAVQDLGAVSTPLFSGAHDESLRAVADGHADLAAIDQQTWTMQQRDMPEAARVRVVGHSRTAPGQTFVTAKGRDPEPLRAALTEAISALPEPARAVLGLRGIVSLPSAEYAPEPGI